MSLDDIARETRLSKRYLAALEDEAIGKLPGGTYNRSYLRTYATFLGLNPEPLLRQYAAEEERQTNAAEQDLLVTMNKAIDRRNQTPSAEGKHPADPASAMASPSVIGGAALLVVALVGGTVWYARSAPDGTIEASSADASTAAASQTASPATTPAAAVQEPPAAQPPAVPAPEASQPPPKASLPTDPVERVSRNPGAVSHLRIPGSGVGTDVVDRKLVGRSDRFSAGSRVVFWTRVVGGRAGDTIDHVWIRGGSVVGAASLSVGSADWRTQSRRVLDPPGDWVVEARDADGHVLARHEFRTSDQ